MPNSSKSKNMNWLHSRAPLLAVLLMLMMGAASFVRPGRGDALPYHRRVADAAGTIPQRIGDWVGTDVEAPREAIKLLNPNVLRSKRYINDATNETATLLFVHCKDAGDMAGHYPARCYPTQGWLQVEREPKDWHIAGLTIQGSEYVFSLLRPEGAIRMVVDNFIIMPDGRTLRDIAGVYEAAADYKTHFYGAGQVQMLTDARMSASRRDEVFHELVGANMTFVEAVRSGFEVRADTGQ